MQRQWRSLVLASGGRVPCLRRVAGQFSQGSDNFAASFRVGQMSADCRTGGETVSSLVFSSEMVPSRQHWSSVPARELRPS